MAKNKLPVASTAAVFEKVENNAQERRWKAEEALRTIEKAEGHRADKSLMKDVKGLAKERIKCLGKIK